MANMFTILLTVATLITGVLWCLNKFVWTPKRQRKVEKIRSETEGKTNGNELAKIGKSSRWIESVSSFFPALVFVFIIRSFLYEPFQIPSGSMMPTLLIGDFILVEKYAYGIREPITNKVIINTNKPKRGDVVVFKYPKDTRLDFIKRTIGLPGDHIKYDTENKTLTVTPSCDKETTDCSQVTYPISYTPVMKSDFIQVFNMGNYSSAFYRANEKHKIPNDNIVLQLKTRKETLGTIAHNILMLPDNISSSDSYYHQPGLDDSEWIVPEGNYFVMGDNRDNSEDSRYWGFVPERNLVGRATAIWISFEKQPDQWPTGVRFNRIGAIH